ASTLLDQLHDLGVLVARREHDEGKGRGQRQRLEREGELLTPGPTPETQGYDRERRALVEVEHVAHCAMHVGCGFPFHGLELGPEEALARTVLGRRSAASQHGVDVSVRFARKDLAPRVRGVE